MKPHKNRIVTVLSLALAALLMLSMVGCGPDSPQNDTPTLESIAVTTMPNKLDYVEGDVFDKTGMVVKATYSNGESYDVTKNVTISPSGALTPSDTTVTISYSEGAAKKEVSLDITVRPIAIPTSISVTAQPKLTYTEGDNFDASSMVVTATYEGGATEALDPSTYTIDVECGLCFEQSGKPVKITYIHPLTLAPTTITCETEPLTVTRNDIIRTNLTLPATTSAEYKSTYLIEAEDFTIKKHLYCEFDEEGNEVKCQHILDETWNHRTPETSGNAIGWFNKTEDTIWMRVDSEMTEEVTASITLYMATNDYDDLDANVLTRWNGEEIVTGFMVKTGNYAGWKPHTIEGLTIVPGENLLTFSMRPGPTCFGNLDKAEIVLNPDAEPDPNGRRLSSITIGPKGEWDGSVEELASVTSVLTSLSVTANYNDGTHAVISGGFSATAGNGANYFSLSDTKLIVSYTENEVNATGEFNITVTPNESYNVKDGWTIGADTTTLKIEAEDAHLKNPGIIGAKPEASGGKKVGNLQSADSVIYIKLQSSVAKTVSLTIKFCFSTPNAGLDFFRDVASLYFNGVSIAPEDGLALPKTDWNTYTEANLFSVEVGTVTLEADKVYTFMMDPFKQNYGNLDYFVFEFTAVD